MVYQLVDEHGKYLGAWDDESLNSSFGPPPGYIEVDEAPTDARQVWCFPGWSELSAQVPESITRRQGRLALLNRGLLARVESAIDGLSDSMQKAAANIEYENSAWARSSQWIDRIGEAAGLTREEIDDLFIEAASL